MPADQKIKSEIEKTKRELVDLLTSGSSAEDDVFREKMRKLWDLDSILHVGKSTR